MPISIKVKGVKKALDALKSVQDELIRELDSEVERAAMRVVNEGRTGAPVLTGQLANSINITDDDVMTRTVSSDKPYFARQEYEHPSKRGFMRKAMANAREPFRNAIGAILKRVGGKI
jgi:hypothetical protein